MMRRLLPDTLAGRFALLLAAAILAANLIGLAVLAVQQQRFDRQSIDDRRIERIAALVPVLETVDAGTRREIARRASRHHAQIRVRNEPLLAQGGSDARSVSIARRLNAALDRDDVRVAFLRRASADRMAHRRAASVMAVTIPLSARQGEAAWLNVRVGGGPSAARSVRSGPFLMFLALSLLCVLGVGTFFASRLARPLRHLSTAARAAGRGDRSARVPEDGPREMRDAAQAFNAMQAEIARFDGERMRMLAAVGHDLRTPMTSLRIRAEMIEDEEQRRAMVRTLDEMTVMADGLVSYARHGRDGEDVQSLDLDDLLERLCRDRGARYSGAPGSPVRGRPVALGRAVGNLIDNAIRYGAEATVTLRRDHEDAAITVEDAGPGIPPDRLDAMFDPFTRGDASRNSATGGAGLGLAIARTIILAHGGTITLENLPQGGLRATVRLPLDR